jgi:hypothetical protein
MTRSAEKTVSVLVVVLHVLIYNFPLRGCPEIGVYCTVCTFRVESAGSCRVGLPMSHHLLRVSILQPMSSL